MPFVTAFGVTKAACAYISKSTLPEDLAAAGDIPAFELGHIASPIINAVSVQWKRLPQGVQDFVGVIDPAYRNRQATKSRREAELRRREKLVTRREKAVEKRENELKWDRKYWEEVGKWGPLGKRHAEVSERIEVCMQEQRKYEAGQAELRDERKKLEEQRRRLVKEEDLHREAKEKLKQKREEFDTNMRSARKKAAGGAEDFVMRRNAEVFRGGREENFTSQIKGYYLHRSAEETQAVKTKYATQYAQDVDELTRRWAEYEKKLEAEKEAEVNALYEKYRREHEARVEEERQAAAKKEKDAVASSSQMAETSVQTIPGSKLPHTPHEGLPRSSSTTQNVPSADGAATSTSSKRRRQEDTEDDGDSMTPPKRQRGDSHAVGEASSPVSIDDQQSASSSTLGSSPVVSAAHVTRRQAGAGISTPAERARKTGKINDGKTTPPKRRRISSPTPGDGAEHAYDEDSISSHQFQPPLT